MITLSCWFWHIFRISSLTGGIVKIRSFAAYIFIIFFYLILWLLIHKILFRSAFHKSILFHYWTKAHLLSDWKVNKTLFAPPPDDVCAQSHETNGWGSADILARKPQFKKNTSYNESWHNFVTYVTFSGSTGSMIIA